MKILLVLINDLCWPQLLFPHVVLEVHNFLNLNFTLHVTNALPFLCRVYELLLHPPVAMGSIPSSPRSQLLRERCSKTLFVSRTMARL